METAQKKILGIGGSPRKNGNTDVLLSAILKGVENLEIESTSIHLRDYIYQSCIGCEKCRKDKKCTGLNDGMTLLYPEIIASQGLVIVSPTYNYNVTSWIKAFLDRLYCFYNFNNERPRGWTSNLAGQNRKAVVAVICEQESKKDMGFTVEAMTMPLQALGYEIIEEIPVFGIFDRGKVKEKNEILSFAENTGKKLAEAVGN